MKNNIIRSWGDRTTLRSEIMDSMAWSDKYRILSEQNTRARRMKRVKVYSIVIITVLLAVYSVVS